MALKDMLTTFKREDSLAKILDQHLIMSYEDDIDRRRDINSPSSALGCVRASYFYKTGEIRKPPHPRLQRIFGNGHGVHYRLQRYLKEAGVLLLKETPLFNKKYNIQGHTDGILSLSDKKQDIAIVEIKSINDGGYTEVVKRRKEPTEKNKAQAQVYLFCLEEQRKYLHTVYEDIENMEADSNNRRKFYANLYAHLQDDTFDGGKTREQKITKKVNEHFKLDNLLITLKKPITKTIIIYENKNNQEWKDFTVLKDDALLGLTLRQYIKSNIYYRLGVCPARECSKRNNTCDFSLICWK